MKNTIGIHEETLKILKQTANPKAIKKNEVFSQAGFQIVYFTLYIHSNSFVFLLKKSANNSLRLLISFERKHAGQKGKMYLKAEIFKYLS